MTWNFNQKYGNMWLWIQLEWYGIHYIGWKSLETKQSWILNSGIQFLFPITLWGQALSIRNALEAATRLTPPTGLDYLRGPSETPWRQPPDPSHRPWLLTGSIRNTLEAATRLIPTLPALITYWVHQKHPGGSHQINPHPASLDYLRGPSETPWRQPPD
jgi:hypothetical protein